MNPHQPQSVLSTYERLESRRARHRRIGFIIAVIAVAVAILATSLAIGIGMTEGEPNAEEVAPSTTVSTSAPAPVTGEYLLRVWDSPWCATAGPEPGNTERTVMVLTHCANVTTPLFVEADGDTIRLSVDFPEDDWRACLSIDAPADGDGYLLGPYACEDAAFADFTVGRHTDGGFTLSIEDSAGRCLDALDSDPADGTALAAWSCDEGTPSQRFEFTTM